MTDTETTGQRIAALRLQRQWKQTDLAARASISPTFLSELENDRREPGMGTLRAIADALGASLDYIVRGTPYTMGPERLSYTLGMLAVEVRALEDRCPISPITKRPMTQKDVDAMFELLDELAVKAEATQKEWPSATHTRACCEAAREPMRGYENRYQ